MAQSLADSLIGTGEIPQFNASGFSGGLDPGIQLSGPSSAAISDLEQQSQLDAPYAPSGSTTIPINSSGLLTGTWFGNLLNSFAGTPTQDSLGFTNSPAANALGLGTNASAGLKTSFWTNIFLRAVIVILGFIFVATGLSMFGNKAAQVIVKETKRSFHA